MSMVMERNTTITNDRLHIGAKRKELWMVDLTGVGSSQSGKRAALVYQNDLGNRHSPCTIIMPLTTKNKKKLPTHVQLYKSKHQVMEDCLVLTEQIVCIDQYNLLYKVGEIDDKTMKEIDRAHLVSVGLSHLIDYVS